MTAKDAHTSQTTHVVSLAEYVREHGGFDVRRPATTYRRRTARLVNPEVAAPSMVTRYFGNPIAELPPEGIAVFDNATIVDGCAIQVAEGPIVAESIYITDGKYREDIAQAPASGRQSFGDAVFVGRPLPSPNYGHFLVDVLPRLLLDLEACPPDAPILLHECAAGFAPAMFAAAGFEPARIEWIGRDPVSVERLFWPTPNTVNPMRHSPHIFPPLRGLVAPERVSSSTRRLFVARRDASTRRLSNDDEVFAHLEPLGFEAVSPGHMPFDAQVHTFAEAEIVVAVCGAALTNMVFMPPGGIVVMLLPSTMPGLFFWDLAHHRDIALSVLWGTNEDQSEDIHTDFRVDVDEVAQSLDVAMALSGQTDVMWLARSVDD
jgi:capsular polysaccharide biosynthesis protein